mmetsp:Transcript_51292/g.125954  ORF Transcript_51292/g.125954 Transcript_51292/m.125954 type:complete len:258 (-) Transcript_51292:49-822(-)
MANTRGVLPESSDTIILVAAFTCAAICFISFVCSSCTRRISLVVACMSRMPCSTDVALPRKYMCDSASSILMRAAGLRTNTLASSSLALVELSSYWNGDAPPPSPPKCASYMAATSSSGSSSSMSGMPDSSSTSMRPQPHTSWPPCAATAGASPPPSTATCAAMSSGAAYCLVPNEPTLWPRLVAPSKSIRRYAPSKKRMTFDGLTSVCTRPCCVCSVCRHLPIDSSMKRCSLRASVPPRSSSSVDSVFSPASITVQ